MQNLSVRLALIAAVVAAIGCGQPGGKVNRAPPSPLSTSSVTTAAHHHHPLQGRMPMPLPGGDTFPLPWSPTQTTLVNSFFPGPAPLFDGQWAEPSTIIDFAGAVAQVYLGGTAFDASGKNKFFVEVDTRAFQGVYVGSDGKLAHGTFCEI